MENLPRRRIDIATCWASNRITVMDNLERYEDSYAVSQEFIEWTSSYVVYSDLPTVSILKVPNFNKENRTD